MSKVEPEDFNMAKMSLSSYLSEPSSAAQKEDNKNGTLTHTQNKTYWYWLNVIHVCINIFQVTQMKGQVWKCWVFLQRQIQVGLLRVTLMKL